MKGDWMTNLANGVKRWPPRDRNWPVVVCLAALSVLLFAAGLYADRALGGSDQEFRYYMLAFLVGAAVPLFYHDRRLFVDRPQA